MNYQHTNDINNLFGNKRRMSLLMNSQIRRHGELLIATADIVLVANLRLCPIKPIEGGRA